MRGGDPLVGMKRIAMAGKRTDLEPAAGDDITEAVEFRFAGEQIGRLAMRVAGIRTGAEFDGVTAEASDVLESLGEGDVAEDRGENADFHRVYFAGSISLAYGTFPLARPCKSFARFTRGCRTNF